MTINFLYCSEGICFAFSINFYKRSFYYYSTLCCSWLASIWACADLIPFLELLFPWEDYFFWEESFCLESFCLLLLVEGWAKPVLVFPEASPCFLLLVFLSLSFCLSKYSAAPGTGNLLWISIDYLSRDKQEKGLVRN